MTTKNLRKYYKRAVRRYLAHPTRAQLNKVNRIQTEYYGVQLATFNHMLDV